MQIKVVLEKDEFEPVLIDLLQRMLKREFTPEETVSIMFGHENGKASTMTATIEPRKPE